MQLERPKITRLPETFLGLRQENMADGILVVNEDRDLTYRISRRQLEALLQTLEAARLLAAGSNPSVQTESWLVGLEAATSSEGRLIPCLMSCPEGQFSVVPQGVV